MTSPASWAGPRPTTITAAPDAPAPKLRDSCHACASSKLKCSKEKPTCARCAKRGKQCQYFVTRRGGRRQSSRPKNDYDPSAPGAASAPALTTVADTSQTGVANMAMTQAPTISVASMTETPTSNTTDDSIQVFLEKYGATFTDIENNSPDHNSEAQRLFTVSPSDMDLMLDDYSALESPMSVDISDLTSINTGTGSNSHDWTFTDSTHSLSIDTGITDPLPNVNNHFDFGGSTPPPAGCPPEVTLQPPLAAATPGHELTLGPISMTSDNSGVSSASDRPCECHPRALEALKQLCSSEAPLHDCTGLSRPTTTRGTRSLQSIIDVNEHVLETVGGMLPCACSQDGFLLATMSLVAFKVMARYEAAARHQPCSSPTAALTTHGAEGVVDGTDHDDLDRVLQDGRVAAQVVLSELYRVQRFLKGLSQRLKQMAGLDTGRDDHVSPLAHRSSRNGAGGRDVIMGGGLDDVALPFSAAFFCQLETDLRRRLRALSAEIADLVRTA